MNAAATTLQPLSNVDMVHESEAQRQHARIRIPGSLTLGGRSEGLFRLNDLSAGGLSFIGPRERYAVGDRLEGELAFRMDGVSFSIPIRLQVANIDVPSQRIGCFFRELGPREIAILRQLITAHLAGEVVTVDDMLSTLSRDNFVRSRKAPAVNERMGLFARARALLWTLLVFVLGCAAFGLAALKVYDLIFVTHAAAAKIAAPTYTVPMPRDGTFFSLVPADGVVRKGQPLGSLETGMLDVLPNGPGGLHLSADELSQLLGTSLKGTITSPCDCKVIKRYALDTQYANHNDPLFELLPTGAVPYVVARFHYDAIANLKPGRQVSFRISGEASERSGTIKELRVLPPAGAEMRAASDLTGINANSAVTDMVAVIEPAEPLPEGLIDRPVEVAVSGLSDLL